MKKNLFFFGFSLIAMGVSAQSISLVNPVAQVIGDASTLSGAGEMVAEWPVTNISDVQIAVKCNRSVITEVPGSLNYFCWGVCYGETTNVSLLAQTIFANDTNSTFYAHYKPQGNPGESIISYCFFNTANPADQACQTVSFCYETSCEIGIEEETNMKFELVGSNPLKGISFLNYQLPAGLNEGELTITNIQGQLVKAATLTGSSGSILVSSEDFASGVYNFTLVTSGGNQNIRIVVE
jgi:hypothetical protein